jgi:excisionase family DNA binding protein
MMDGPDSLLTPSQLAAWLQLPLSTLYRWRTQGDGPAGVKIGRHLRYKRSVVQAWIDGGGNDCPTPRPDSQPGSRARSQRG